LRTVQVQRTSTSSSASTGRPKAKDFDDVTQEVIGLAIAFYRCYISSKNSFPDHALELEFIADAWRAACQRLNLEMEITPTISKLVRRSFSVVPPLTYVQITNRGSHLRGELKTKMKPTVELIYGFKTGQNKKTIAHNRQLAEQLKEDLTFTFKVRIFSWPSIRSTHSLPGHHESQGHLQEPCESEGRQFDVVCKPPR
jgi:hypothetical protein